MKLEEPLSPDAVGNADRVLVAHEPQLVFVALSGDGQEDVIRVLRLRRRFKLEMALMQFAIVAGLVILQQLYDGAMPLWLLIAAVSVASVGALALSISAVHLGRVLGGLRLTQTPTWLRDYLAAHQWTQGDDAAAASRHSRPEGD